jgi:hypothetical protein
MFAVAIDSGAPAVGRPTENDALSYVPRDAAAFRHQTAVL